MTEVLSLGQYYSIDCITGPVPTGVSVSWILTNGSIYSNNNTLVISPILPSHNNTQYTCNIKVMTDSICMAQNQMQAISVRIKSTEHCCIHKNYYYLDYINSVLIVPSSRIIEINESVVLSCIISLNFVIDPSFISYSLYSTSITVNTLQPLISNNGKILNITLQQNRMQPSDAGIYECRASINGSNISFESLTHVCVQGQKIIHENLLNGNNVYST